MLIQKGIATLHTNRMFVRKIGIIIFLIYILISVNGCNSQKVQLDYNESNYKYISISADHNKFVGRESTDSQLIKNFLSDISKLHLVPFKKETDLVSGGDYWIMLRDTADPMQAKYSMLFRPMGSTLMINDKIYDIKKGHVNFKEYYDMCNAIQEP